MPIEIPTGEPKESGGRFINELRVAFGQAAPLDGTTPINQVETHLFFEQDGAKAFRWGDRAYFGAAVQGQLNRDWSEALRGGTGGSFSGVVNVAGTAVTRVSGDSFITAASVFSTYSPWVGQTIIINGTPRIILSVASGNSLTLTASGGTLSGVTYVVGQGMIQSGSGATVNILTDPISAASANNFPLFTAGETQQFVPGGSGNGAGYGFCSVHVNNSPTEQTTGWAIYSEAHRMNETVFWAVGMEMEVVNRGLSYYTDPYNSHNNKQVQALQVGAGAGLSSVGQTNPTTALMIFNNGSFFNAGIMFTSASIAAAGPLSSISAIQLPLAYEVQWFSAANTLAGRIFTDAASVLHLDAPNNVMVQGLNRITNDYANLNIYSTDAHGADKGGQLGLGGNRTEAFQMPFAKLRGAPETGGSNAGYLELSTMNAAGTIAAKMRIGSIGHTLPGANYLQNFGALDKKWLSIYAAELWVETLVAQDTIATIGGRILVGPTTALTSDLLAAGTSIIVKHNQMVSGDRVYMESNGKVEFMAITSAPSGAGPYTYTVTRNLDGSGANDWFAGDAVFNTGQTGNGFIDIYSRRGVRAGTELGPTIAGNTRNSATFNDWSTAWAIGNLDGLYGYSGTTFGTAFGKHTAPHVTIDATNGYRAWSNDTTVRFGITTAGVMSFFDSAGVAKITLDASAGMTLDGKLQMLGASSAMAIGVVPPLSSVIGTGLWQDRTGLYGILGVQQVETATVIGTVTGSGNAAVIVTAASMIGTPHTVQVPVLNTDSASTVAGKIRTGLAADSIVAVFFTVSGAGADVVLTDKYGRANDATMNINIANGTCTGLTTVNSVNTTAGSNTTQAKFDAVTGAIVAAAGNALLDVNGITIKSTSPASTFLGFQHSGTASASIQTTAIGFLNIQATHASTTSSINLVAQSGGTNLPIADFTLTALPGASARAYATLWSESGTAVGLTIGANAAPSGVSALDVRGGVAIGPVAFTPADLVHIRKDQNLRTALIVDNQTSGTASSASILTQNASGVNQFGVYSAGTTAYGAIAAATAFFYTNTVALTIMVDNASGILKFATGGNAEKMRLSAAANLKIAGTAVRATTEGTNHLDIFDGTSPAGTLAAGCSLYSRTGELYAMDAAGNETIQSPHDKETGEWIFWSKNTVSGKVLRVDMERLMKAIDAKLGGGFIREYMEPVN